ncbi:hypothetical protein [Knoellia sp. LjRoot47]|uniref:hypothetical protein n=1 Tax=Knoellia sp. LjRoot47 TaxID=3342330 RepID=UPI003ECDBD8A
MSTRRLRNLEAPASAGQRVYTLAELTEAGVSRGTRRNHVEAERWRSIPHRGVVVDCGPLDPTNAWRAALAEVACTARLGGVTALQAAGVTGLSDTAIHVWVRKSVRKGRSTMAGEVVLHESRRWDDADAVDSGIPRARPAVAAVQAALWSRSVREASLMLVLPVQQRLVTADHLLEAFERVRRHEFRNVLRQVLADIRAGGHSMNELDFVRLCGAHGIPAPAQQVVRRGPDGRIYVDCRWERQGVSLEIQGAGHGDLLNSLDDDLRLLGLVTDGDVALSVSVLTLRIDAARWFQRFGALLRSRERAAQRPAG